MNQILTQTMNDMNYNDELAHDIAAYNSLQSEQDKQAFLTEQRQKIAQMTPEQRQLHQEAIAQAVNKIGHRVEESRRSTTV